MVSRVARALAQTGSRFLSTTAAESTYKTQILIVHEGFPKSEFYAKKALTNEATNYYNLPKSLKWEIPSFLVPGKVGQCMEDYGKFGDVQETIMTPLASSLETSLLYVMPELESVRVLCASPFESPTISESIDKVASSGATRLIILPLQPHFECITTGLLINEVVRCIDLKTLESKEGPTRRIVAQTPTEFEVSSIERWSTHPVISNLWSTILESKRSEIDGVIFVAPILRGHGRKDYERSVYASAERTISETRVPRPWRVAFFNGWNHWDLPIRENISSQLKHFKDKRVAVIPITSVVPSFNTISVLPRLISSMDRVKLLNPTVNSILVDGLTEAIKNHLLGKRSGQLQLKCNWCFRSDCQLTREILC
ncbi:hypothetical protein PFISCL1PPCAC_19642 [Pristionchus fissidentatus]|uniref:Ferrochelatase n=1 Tax=Pristionchus fissidentatus TaxID=1538716 RepID=A0AAV5WCK2_9BILA|nr:hypothetical protein PFISCL1PPCAC_19642 [Pristionchus fissidentatus]